MNFIKKHKHDALFISMLIIIGTHGHIADFLCGSIEGVL